MVRHANNVPKTRESAACRETNRRLTLYLMIQRYVFEFIISSCGGFDCRPSANVANGRRGNVFERKPRITVQDASNVSNPIKCASTCRKASQKSPSPSHHRPRPQNQWKKALPSVLITSTLNLCSNS